MTADRPRYISDAFQRVIGIVFLLNPALLTKEMIAGGSNPARAARRHSYPPLQPEWHSLGRHQGLLRVDAATACGCHLPAGGQGPRGRPHPRDAYSQRLSRLLQLCREEGVRRGGALLPARAGQGGCPVWARRKNA